MSDLNQLESYVLAARMTVAAKRVDHAGVSKSLSHDSTSNLKQSELVQAINTGKVNPFSLKVDLCGQRVHFTYFDGKIAYLTQVNGEIKVSDNPRAVINCVLSKVSY